MVMIGHDLSEKEIWERVENHWDLSGIFPRPPWNKPWCCPQCRSQQIFIKGMVFNRRSGSPRGYRCDVAFKCSQCSCTWVHGVPVKENMWRYHHDKGKTSYTWREIREELKGRKSDGMG